MPLSWVAISLAGAKDTSVWGINDAGRIVGGFSLAVEPSWGGGRRHGFLDSSARTFATITGPKTWGEKIWKNLLRGHFRTTAQGINDAGQIVGTFWSGLGQAHGFLRSSEGVVTIIDAPGAPPHIEPNISGTHAHGINDAGQIVGFFRDAAGAGRGFLRSPEGVFITIDVPGAQDTGAVGINNAGQIVGFSRDAAGRHHGFLRSPDSAFTTIDAPGATDTTAWGINDAGEIVGAFRDAAGTAHGFLRTSEGAFTMIEAPGAAATIAIGINNAAQIVGFFEEAAGGSRGFIATPAAENSATVAQRTLDSEDENAPPSSQSLRRFRESLAGIVSILLILGILPVIAFGLMFEVVRLLVPSLTLAHVARTLERGADYAMAVMAALFIVVVVLASFVLVRHAITYVKR